MDQLLRLWGKTVKGSTDPTDYHPALYHMLDVGHVARALLAEPATPRWRLTLARALGVAPESLAAWLPCWVALHDIGKVSAAFQISNAAQRERLAAAGLPFGVWREALKVYHPEVSQVFSLFELAALPALAAWPAPWRRACYDAFGGHHGRFAAVDQAKTAYEKLQSYEPPAWAAWRAEAAQVLAAEFLREVPAAWPGPGQISAAVMALTGFTILCDWLGSDENHFAACPDMSLDDYRAQSLQAAQNALAQASFLHPTRSAAPVEFARLFPKIQQPRPLQLAVDAIPASILAAPCLAIIEAPTGEGKTEAALALAHRLAQAHGADEFYYALPTTATSNSMFERVQEHLRDRLGLPPLTKLIHGQAFLMEDDLRVKPLENGTEEDTKAALEWFGPKKRALQAPFGVGTIDQAELAALSVRHGALRLAGLAGKVIILDEVHAYDTYMTTIIERLLGWLAALGSSVILLSATLPQARRAALARAYGAEPPTEPPGLAPYPSLWVLGPAGRHQATPGAHQPARRLALSPLQLSEGDPAARAQWLLDAVAGGGCACWMTNTVRRAQELYRALQQIAPADTDLMLLHAQFPLEERLGREEELKDKYGPPPKAGGPPRRWSRPPRGIVIGTQVLEQSLDLDFDVLVSDLAPIDLLLQRAGRLHRHARPRPSAHDTPRLWIAVEMEDGGGLRVGVDRYIYAEYILRRTWAVLDPLDEIVLPAGYRPLIEAVYGAPPPAADSPLAEAWNKLQKEEGQAQQEAVARLIPTPDPRRPFTAAAQRPPEFVEDESRADWIAARTRLGEESVTVIPLERAGRMARALPGEEPIPLDRPAPREVELRLLRRSLRIGRAELVEALRQLKETELTPLFTAATLLKGYVPLWLEGGAAALSTPRGPLALSLDPALGLVIPPQGGKA